MQFTPITWSRIVERLAERITAPVDPASERPAPVEAAAAWTRVVVDGAPAACPWELADGLAEALRTRGRPVQRVSAAGFWRPASLRLEYGHEDADAYYDLWLDTGALRREVLDPLGPGGSGRVLPALWDARTDRATRAEYVALPPGGVLLLDGPLLLGRGLAFELSVHVRLSPAALSRRTPPGEQWTLPAFARYAAEVRPEQTADLVVRADDPRHPAWNG